MSQRDVAQEIMWLVALVNDGLPDHSEQRISVDEVRQFIAGAKAIIIPAPGISLSFPVAQNECAVVVCIEQFNTDDSDPTFEQTMIIGSEGVGETRNIVSSRWAMGADVFYVFGPGRANIQITASIESGATYFARVRGYYLPQRATTRLSRCGTKVITLLN